MSSAKLYDIRKAQRWSVPDLPPIARRGREHWVVRWIGAAKRRLPKLIERTCLPDAAIDTPKADIIHLRWVDTLGRPACVESANPIVQLPPPQGR